ncbi:hypothetical protein tinsulaeT_24590 [Thalassotalea insulae]|uniref:Solute-binding protein family 3/N-terminal domain-containing protein n=1 Tax=Thalassotalea insulae TaxID=2056778 RepID=A0ABQ6GV97_9GAMM|nr:transporter substrate-binding domain-containing protein [Thalassotalea insulae]GLX79119.1 hypothetical protein tinsulaeT_24590 [Thalassotalea insulae]
MKCIGCLIGLLLVVSETIAASDTVVRFCYEEWQPYAYLDSEGKHRGLSIEYIEQKLKKVNINYQFRELPFPLCKQHVISGHFDFILHVDDTDNLQLLNQTIGDWQLTFAVAKNNPISYEQVLNSQGMKVLIARSYSYPEALDKKLKEMSAKVIKVSYYTGEFVALQRLFHRLTVGQAQVMVIDKVWAQQVVSKYQLPIRVFDQVLLSQPQYIGYSESNAELASIVESTLAAGND